MVRFGRLLQDDRGEGMTEYAVVVGSLAIGALAGLIAIRARVNDIFDSSNSQLATVPTG